MRKKITDKIINEAFEYLLKGYTPQEIKNEMFLSEAQWKSISETARLATLLHSAKDVPNAIKIKEIEDNLFGLLYRSNRSDFVNERIEALQSRYSSFLL